MWLGAAHNPDGVLIEVKLSTYGYPVAGLLTGVVISYGMILVAEALEKRIPAVAAPVHHRGSHRCDVLDVPPPGDPVCASGHTRVRTVGPDFLVALLVPYIIAVVCLRRGWLTWLTGAPRPPLPVAEKIGRLPLIGRPWRSVVMERA